MGDRKDMQWLYDEKTQRLSAKSDLLGIERPSYRVICRQDYVPQIRRSVVVNALKYLQNGLVTSQVFENKGNHDKVADSISQVSGGKPR